jgi:hypothetical protein
MKVFSIPCYEKIFKIFVVLQKCIHLVEVVPGSYSETLHTGVQDVNVKTEESAKTEDEQFTAPVMKAEREVSYICMYILFNSLIPWHKNPKVHHHIHNISPLTPILSQLNPIHSPSQLPKIYSDTILPSTPWSSSGLFPSGFPTKTLYMVLSCVPHALPTLFALT